jgi:hypothetical protein
VLTARLSQQRFYRLLSFLMKHALWEDLMDLPGALHDTHTMAFGLSNAFQLLAHFGVPAEQIRDIRVDG